MEFKSNVNADCCTPTGKYELCGCADGVAYVQLTVVGGGTVQTAWLNTETGDTFTTKPPGFVTGTCQEAALSDILKFSQTAPTATAPFTAPKDGYTTIQTADGTATGAVTGLWLYEETTATWKLIPTVAAGGNLGDVYTKLPDGSYGWAAPATQAILDNQVLTGGTGTNTTVTMTPVTVTDESGGTQVNYTVTASAKIDGTTIVEDPTTKVLSAANQKPDVLTTAQPTPTATGNTTNLNSVFKDASGSTWFVDYNGDAVLMGSAPFKELNRFYVDPNGLDTNTGANEAPYLTAAAAVAALTANDTAVLNEGTYAAVTMSVQNTALAGASGAYGSLSQIAAVTVSTASGTSNKISDLTITGNLARTGNAPLYLNNTTVGGNVTLAGTAYTEIRDSSIQDGSITVSGASTLLIEDSKIGTSTFNTAGSAIALRNGTIDPGDTVTFGPGVVYSLSGTTGNVVRDPAAINVEDALVAAGLSAAQAEGAVTTHFHHIRMHNADEELAPTQVVTRDPVTGELEYSPLSAIAPNETTGYGTAAPTVAGANPGDTFYVTPLGTQADAANATAQYRWDGTQWVLTPGAGGSTLIHERDVEIATAGMTSHTLPDTPVGKVIVTRNGVDISDAWDFTGAVGTYSSAANFGCVIDAGDKLEFHYEKEGSGTASSSATAVADGVTILGAGNSADPFRVAPEAVKSSVKARWSAITNLAANTSIPVANLTQTQINTTPSQWNATTGVYTAPAAGLYMVSANVTATATLLNGSYLSVDVRKNGFAENVFVEQSTGGGTVYITANGTVPMLLAAGDTISFAIYANVASQTHIAGTNFSVTQL